MVELVKESAAEGYLPSLNKTVQTLIFRESRVKYENFYMRSKMHVLDAKHNFPFTVFQVPSPQQEGFNNSQYND